MGVQLCSSWITPQTLLIKQHFTNVIHIHLEILTNVCMHFQSCTKKADLTAPRIKNCQDLWPRMFCDYKMKSNVIVVDVWLQSLFLIGSVLGLNCHVHSYSYSAAMLHNKTHFNIRLASWLSPCSSYIFQCGHLKWPFRHRTHLLMYSQTSESRDKVRERDGDKEREIYIYI